MTQCYTRVPSEHKTFVFIHTFIQRRPNVFDVGPTLYKCYTNVVFTRVGVLAQYLNSYVWISMLLSSDVILNAAFCCKQVPQDDQ